MEDGKDTITISFAITIPKDSLRIALEKNEPLNLSFDISSIQLERERFFKENEKIILFLSQPLENLGLSVRAFNLLQANRCKYCYEIAEKLAIYCKARNWGKKSESEFFQVYEEVGLNLSNCDLRLINAAKDRVC